MLSKIKLAVLLSILCHVQLNAQTLEYKKYKWEENPKLHVLSKEEQEDNYTILKDKVLLDFVYEEPSGELVMYETKHMIIHFNDDKGIEEMNKIYIPTSAITEEIDLKGRTITSTGKVIPLSKSSIKKVENYEDAGPFIIFAMEGIDKGSEIEYMYTNKKTIRLNNSMYVQTDKIKKDFSIDIYSPKNLFFEGKGYNGFPDFTTDTLTKTKNHIYAYVDKMKALYDEKYSAVKACRMRVDYQIAYNTVKSNARIYTWEQIGNNIYGNLFTFSKAETKSTDKFISKLDLNKLTTDEAKIRTLEQFAKSNINYKELDEYIPVDKMLELKYGNKTSFLKLYIAVAQNLNIPCEVVATCNRTERKFDNTFQSLNNIDEYMLYYPTLGKYLCPDNFYSRLGFPSPALMGNKGLFIKETQVGDLKTGLSKVKNIEIIPVTSSSNNMTASVTFNADNFLPLIKLKQEFTGYNAYSVQPAMFYQDADKRKEFSNEVSKIMGVETVVKSAVMKGLESADVMVNPLVIESVIETPHLIENAGNKYLFKVGEMLGQQEQLYQEKERQTDVDVIFPHSYTRNFEIKIPAGYKIKNLDDINMDKRYVADGKEQASFISGYKVEGDVLKINVFEDYKSLTYPKSNFEQYRSVVNASADFNKVLLIFEKI